MLDRLFDVLGNSHFEAWVAGGLTGALYANIFDAFKKKPPQERSREESPSEAEARLREQRQRERPAPREVVREVHHHHYRGGPAAGGDDSAAVILFVGAVLLIVGTFAFAAYLPRISETLYFSVTTIAAFSFFSSLLAALGGRFKTAEWWLRGLGPGVLSLGCFAVAETAERAINPEVVAYAQQLQAGHPHTFGGYVAAAMQFYRSINSEYASWMLFIMLAFVLVVACALICCVQCVHFIALANARDTDTSWWRSIVWATRKVSGPGWLVFGAALLVGAELLASGTVYQWLH